MLAKRPIGFSAVHCVFLGPGRAIISYGAPNGHCLLPSRQLPAFHIAGVNHGPPRRSRREA